MKECNDCKKIKKEPLLIRGVSNLAGGEYYHGKEICEDCMIDRRESAIIFHNLKIDTIDHSFYDEC